MASIPPWNAGATSRSKDPARSYACPFGGLRLRGFERTDTLSAQIPQQQCRWNDSQQKMTSGLE